MFHCVLQYVLQCVWHVRKKVTNDGHKCSEKSWKVRLESFMYVYNRWPTKCGHKSQNDGHEKKYTKNLNAQRSHKRWTYLLWNSALDHLCTSTSTWLLLQRGLIHFLLRDKGIWGSWSPGPLNTQTCHELSTCMLKWDTSHTYKYSTSHETWATFPKQIFFFNQRLTRHGSSMVKCYSSCSVLQCVAMCCSELQCVAVSCSVLQCFAVCCSV